MKQKTSISVSGKLLKMIDTLPDKPTRSAIVEEALILYFKSRKVQIRNKRDLDILNTHGLALNKEALETLDFQKD